MLIPIAVLLLAGLTWFVVRVVRAIRARQWRRVAWQAGGLAALLITLTLGVVGSERFDFADDLTKILGVKVSPFWLPTTTFSFDSGRTLTGDGYSLDVYELPPDIRARFVNAKDADLSQWPQLTDDREKWKAVPWRHGWVDPAAKEYIGWATASGGEAPEVMQRYTKLKQILGKPTTYYAFFVKMQSFDGAPNLECVDLFVIDTAGNELYIVNQNT